MELPQIVERYAEAIAHIDLHTPARPGRRPGFKSLHEPQAVKAIDETWDNLHKGELAEPRTARGRVLPRCGVRYPNIPRAGCDHVFSTQPPLLREWAVEVKNIATIGANGRRNDYGVSKVVSPWLKDRSLMHDIARLRYHELAQRHAVIGYAFNYTSDTCDELARRHPGETAAIDDIREVLDSNGGDLVMRPLLDFADSILLARGMVKGPRVEASFEAWEHPTGGEGVVFGWEVRRPEMEPGFDPRHPW